MKKGMIITMLVGAALVSSCGSNKKMQYEAKKGSPFGEVYEAPCAVYDSDKEFTATGIYRGSKNQVGQLHVYALQNAQQIVRLKIKHAYKGMVSDYSQNIGNNQGNDLETRVQIAGDQIIDAVVNDTKESCTRYGEVEDDGHMSCYVAISVAKEDLTKKIAKAVEDKLSQEDKLKIAFDEKVFREEMDKRFKQYKEEEASK